MSGHSKWHNIRVKKMATDAKRGKVYTRHARLIEMAARNGADPGMNPSLRTAIDNAKADSVPNANIDRAIKKGSGQSGGEAMAETVYAAMGPGGVACLIECLTDNKNRTLGNVKVAISKGGGSFADSASVLWMFDRKGVVSASKTNAPAKAVEEMELELIDFGAQDIDHDGDHLTVTTEAADWPKIREFLKQNGWTVSEAGLKFVAKQKTAVTDLETAKKLMAFIEKLEEDDDVSEVHTNADIAAETASHL